MVQALDGWRGIKTIESLSDGLNLTATGKGVMIVMGLIGLGDHRSAAGKNQLALARFQFEESATKYRLVNLPQGQAGSGAGGG